MTTWAARRAVLLCVVGAWSCSSADAPIGRPATGVNAVARGAGCGKPLPADQPRTVPGTPSGYKQFTVMATGTTLEGPIRGKAGPRTFWVRPPNFYDPDRAYRVVYLGQGCGDSGHANTQTYPLYDEGRGGTEQAIYVALDTPTDFADMNCYDVRSGALSQELEAFELIHTVVDRTYCVDNDRVYVAGYQFGATLADLWGCYFAGDGQTPAGDPTMPRAFAPAYHIRAQAGVVAQPSMLQPCNGPVAAIWIADDGSQDASIVDVLDARDAVLARNGCAGSPFAPWHDEVFGSGLCRRYAACPADYPVVFCMTTGQGSSDQHDKAIPAFKLFFDLLNPLP